MAAARNSRNARRICSAAIAQTTTGTSRMRANVMRFGILKLGPGSPARRSMPRPTRLRFRLSISAIRPLHTIAIPTYGQQGMSDKRRLTYAQAGVDIDAGNRMVEMIKPLVRATARPGADAEIGGFGGLFDLKRAGFKDPVLVAANDGVGTKVKIAIETGLPRHDRHRSRRHVGQRSRRAGRRAAVLPRLFRHRQARSRRSAPRSSRASPPAAAGRLRADRRRDRGNARRLSRRRLRSRRLCRRRGRARRDPAARRYRAQATWCSASPPPACIPTAIRWCARSSPRVGLAMDAPAPFDKAKTLGEAVLTPTRIYVKSLLAAIRETAGGQGAGAHHRRRISRQHSARAAEEHRRAHRSRRAFRCRRCSSGWRETGGIAEKEMLRTFNCGIGMIAVVEPRAADAVAAVLTREGETRRAARRARRRGERQAARDVHRPARHLAN